MGFVSSWGGFVAQLLPLYELDAVGMEGDAGKPGGSSRINPCYFLRNWQKEVVGLREKVFFSIFFIVDDLWWEGWTLLELDVAGTGVRGME